MQFKTINFIFFALWILLIGSVTSFDWGKLLDLDGSSECGGTLHGTDPNPPGILSVCEGDCDYDNDCEGDLKCHQRNAGDPNPPGCEGTPYIDFDYCACA
eukprot:880875_1